MVDGGIDFFASDFGVKWLALGPRRADAVVWCTSRPQSEVEQLITHAYRIDQRAALSGVVELQI